MKCCKSINYWQKTKHKHSKNKTKPPHQWTRIVLVTYCFRLCNKFSWFVFSSKQTKHKISAISNRMRPSARASVESSKGNNSTRQTRDTTTATCIAYGNSTWHASKYKVHKHHQRYIEDAPLVEFLYLLTCQVELRQAIHVFVVVSLVWQDLSN